MILTDIITFLGRFHPLVVHLPIGFLLMGAVFNVLSYFPNYRSLKDAMSFTLLAGFISALAACVLGYLLSKSGEYDPDVLSQHRLSGILLAILSGILWSLTTGFYSRFMMISKKIVTTLCLLLVLLTAYTGHQGGTLTHGSDYLSLETLRHQTREKPAKAEDALVFEDVILPMFERRCEGCHQKGKRKGRLIVSTYAQLMKGGKHGPVLVPGKPEESELYRRITLDPGHEDFMPTDGKTPLTKIEIEIIRWWIESADASEGRKLLDVKGYEKITPLVASLLKLPGARPLPEPETSAMRAVNAAIPSKTDMAAVSILRQKGLTVRVMLHEPVMLDVTMPAKSGITMRDIEKELSFVAGNVIWLNVSDNNLTENDLQILKQMANLEKLRLEKNPVGDGIVDLLSQLQHLEAVNLNETLLSDSGLARLHGHPGLQRVYSWNAAVTETKQ
jgi:uncharacterized membrane protein